MNADTEPTADPENVALTRAIGAALSMLVSMMQARGVMSMSEAAHMMALLGASTCEIDERQGLIISYWASLLEDLADSPNAPKPN